MTPAMIIAGNNDTSDNLSPVSFTPLNSLSPVSMIPTINTKLQISLRIFVKIWNDLNGRLRGPRGPDSWKNLKPKILCQTSFNLSVLLLEYCMPDKMPYLWLKKWFEALCRQLLLVSDYVFSAVCTMHVSPFLIHISVCRCVARAETGVLDELYSVKPAQLSSHTGPPGYVGCTPVPAYVDWRACTATPLSGISWQ
jgi:hypothetical protein